MIGKTDKFCIDKFKKYWFWENHQNKISPTSKLFRETKTMFLVRLRDKELWRKVTVSFGFLELLQVVLYFCKRLPISQQSWNHSPKQDPLVFKFSWINLSITKLRFLVSLQKISRNIQSLSCGQIYILLYSIYIKRKYIHHMIIKLISYFYYAF